MNFTFFWSVHGTFSGIDHILGHTCSLGEFKKIEIISSIISDQNVVRLDVNYRKKTIKNTNKEQDFLECEVKWAWESITTNKASGGDGIPVELFQILKDDAVKVLHSICQQIWKTHLWPQDWKSQFSFQSQRKAMQKNAQTTTELHSSHTLVK